MKKLTVEFIGAFFLVFTIGCAVTSGTLIPGLAIGSVLMVMVYAGGHISGAHYNPAVSLAVYMRGRMTAGEMIQYWIVQLIGGVLGAVLSYFVMGENPGAVHHEQGQNVSHVIALIAELLGTFALAFVVLNVATSKGTAGNSFFGLAIGFTIFSMAASLGPVSGGAFNPAVGIGRNLAALILTGADIGHVWIYIVGPLVGGAAAALVFKMVNTEEEIS